MGSAGIFDIIGPVMVGPSSSHTAGMVKLGHLARVIFKQYFGQESQKETQNVRIILNKSLEETYRGHGTYKALIGGFFLDYGIDNENIRNAYENALLQGIRIPKKPEIEVFSEEAHPNSVMFVFGQDFYLLGSSIGGGRVKITTIKIPGMGEFKDLKLITGEYLTLVVFVHKDESGIISFISNLLAEIGVNIPSMEYHRVALDGNALFEGWLEKEREVSEQVVINAIEEKPAISKCMLIKPL
jgi:L-serine dehydratase